MDWYYKQGTVDLSIPVYVETVLHKHHHKQLGRKQYAPHKWNIPDYDVQVQRQWKVTNQNHSHQKSQKNVQKCWSLFCIMVENFTVQYWWHLEQSLFHKQKPQWRHAKAIIQLIDYYETYPNSKLMYTNSNMVLRIHRDASYLS